MSLTAAHLNDLAVSQQATIAALRAELLTVHPIASLRDGSFNYRPHTEDGSEDAHHANDAYQSGAKAMEQRLGPELAALREIIGRAVDALDSSPDIQEVGKVRNTLLEALERSSR